MAKGRGVFKQNSLNPAIPDWRTGSKFGESWVSSKLENVRWLQPCILKDNREISRCPRCVNLLEFRTSKSRGMPSKSWANLEAHWANLEAHRANIEAGTKMRNQVCHLINTKQYFNFISNQHYIENFRSFNYVTKP